MKPFVKYLYFVGALTLCAGIGFVLPDFLDNPVTGAVGVAQIAAYWAVVVVANFLWLYALAACRPIFYVVFPLYCLLGAVVAYFRYAFSATLTPMLLDATFHNDWRTSLELITPGLLCCIAAALAFAALAIRARRRLNLPGWGWHAAAGLLLLAGYVNSHPRIHSGCMQRYPCNVYYNLRLYLESRPAPTKRTDPDAQRPAPTRTDTLTLVLVIGESLRTDHLAIAGYDRPTTPRLARRSNLVVLPHIYSEYTYTNRSLPHLLTRADSAHEERAFSETSFVPSFRRDGFRTTWVANQDAADTYVDFIHECDSAIFVHPEKTVYVYDEWLDTDILPHLDRLLAPGHQAPTRQLLILHTIGSHWYYVNHCPKRLARFQPVTRNREVKRNRPEEIINAYDNTVLATDEFLDEVIRRLEGRTALLIYLSDHGEALGENGDWLHASHNEAIKHPAALVWYSDHYARRYPQKVNALRRNATRRYRTDFLYHSLLSGGCVSTPLVEPGLNIFQP